MKTTLLKKANIPGAFAPVVAEVPLHGGASPIRAPIHATVPPLYLQLAPTPTPTPARAITRHNPDAYCFACNVNGHRTCKTPVPSGPFGSQLLWVDPTYLPIPPIPPIPPTPPASPFFGHPGAPAYRFRVCPISLTQTSHGRHSRSSRSSSGSGGNSPACGLSAPTSG